MNHLLSPHHNPHSFGGTNFLFKKNYSLKQSIKRSKLKKESRSFLKFCQQQKKSFNISDDKFRKVAKQLFNKIKNVLINLTLNSFYCTLFIQTFNKNNLFQESI